MKRYFLYLTVSIIAACAARGVDPGAHIVEVISEVSEFHHCRYLGKVKGIQGNVITGEFTPDKNLNQGARNELKNSAYRLGGNMVTIESEAVERASRSSANIKVTIAGKAWKCE